MRKALIGLLVLLFLMALIAPAASAFVWSPPPGPIKPQPTPWSPGAGVGAGIKIPDFTPPRLPDLFPAAPTPTDEIKMTLSEAEESALSDMSAGEHFPVYFALPEAFDNQELIWSSSNENVALAITSLLIDPMGRRAKIHAVSSGTAVITVRTADDSFFYQFTVTVN